MLQHSFPNLSEHERYTLMQAADFSTYRAGETVVTEGDLVESLMIVAVGMLRVTHNLDGRLSEFVGPLGPGAVVGEMSFVDGKPASATLIADGDTEVLSIPHGAVNNLMENDPTFAGRFYKDLFLHLAQRLRATNIRAGTAAQIQ